MYVSMSLSDKIVRDHYYGGLISYVGEWHEEVPAYDESSGKSILGKSMRSISCGYKFILCDYIIHVYVIDKLY